MYKIKPFSLGFAVLLLLSMAPILVPVSADEHAAAAIWIDPGSYLTAPELDTLKKGDTFTVDIMVNVTAASASPAQGLYGWDYVLVWNSTNINLTSYTVNIPPEWGGNWFKPKDELGHYPTCEDYHWVGVSALAPAPPLNETSITMPISIATYNFHVIKTVYQPSPDEIGTLDLRDTKLADDAGNPIIHTTTDALYRKCARPHCITGDLNCDGVVDIFDVVLVAIAYGSSFLLGDINCDGIVDDIDVDIVEAAFGSKPGDANWNPDADLNSDLVVDAFDMGIVSAEYGKRSNYDPIADVNNDLVIDIYDLVLVTSNFGKKL